MASHRSLSALCSLVLVAVGAAGTRAAGQVADPSVPGEAIVRAKVGFTVQAVIAELEAALPDEVTFGVLDESLAARRMYLLSYEPASSQEQVEIALHSLAQSKAGEWGELLYEGHDPEGHTGSVWFHSVGGAADLYLNQYAIEMLGVPGAQDRSSGQGVVVAVLDTGIDGAHPVLQGHFAPGGYNFITDNADTAAVGDGFDNDGDGVTDESVGHGTFVAGLIHLVAPEASLLPVVVLNSDGIGDGWSFARGMFHAIDRGVEVINLSLGSTYKSEAMEAALDEADQLGIAVVAAGGNQNAGEAFEEFPAAGGNAFGVAAVDDLDVKADFSNYHDKFFISAPGTSAAAEGSPDGFDPQRSIYSTLPGAEYGIWKGTSFSTAFVSGAAALIRAQHPEWPAGEVTNDSLATAMAVTAIDISQQNPGFDGMLGAGRVDIGAAALLGPPAPTPGDLNNDGSVGILDLLTLLAQWSATHSAADLDGNGSVDILDLLILLGNWG